MTILFSFLLFLVFLDYTIKNFISVDLSALSSSMFYLCYIKIITEEF